MVLGRSIAAMLGGALLAAAAIAGSAADTLHVLNRIEPGLWDIKSTDDRDGGRSLCVVDPADLLQLGHPHLSCSRFTIDNQAQQATVHYSCPRAGSGQTKLRVETPRLLQIETQGILRNAPFSMNFEARRIGSCSLPRK